MKVVVFVPVEMDCVKDPEIFIGNDAEARAANAFLKHTGVEYSSFLQAEDRDELLAISETIGTRIVTNKPEDVSTQERFENLDQENVDYVKKVLSDLNEAKYYTDQASDKRFQLLGKRGEQIGDYMSEIYQQLEQIESLIVDTYPQATEV